MPELLAFTFGPVQSFVAQARRTRDLWAGSWLLAYLAECALAAAERAGAIARLPYRPPEVRGRVQAIEERRLFGGLPNRFLVEAPDPVAAAHAASAALADAWRRVADAVWNAFVAPVAELGQGTDAIWQRQVASLWEVAWVVGEQHVLAARKRWRRHPLPSEPGDHCALVPELQELSGIVGDRAAQAAFWDALRQRLPSPYDLEPDERLSAVGLIKRLFPYVGHEAVGFDLGEARSWPSTSWLAASPWIERAYRAAPEALQRFVAAVRALPWPTGDPPTTGAAARRSDDGELGAAASLEGGLWFEGTWRRPTTLGLPPDVELTSLQRAYRELTKAAGPPAPFLAVLRMDGDRLGELLAAHAQDPEARTTLSRLLHEFARAVPEVVRRHGGYTVYAGGDDLLALLPAPSALACADELEVAYQRHLRPLATDRVRPSISGVVLYTPYREPLRTVVAEAYHLLDHEAKERAGRGALALARRFAAGGVRVWSAPWEVLRGDHDPHARPFAAWPALTGAGRPLGTTFLHHLERTLGRLLSSPGDAPFLTDELLAALVADALDRSAEHRGDAASPPSDELVRGLITLLRPAYRDPGGSVVVDRRRLTFDAIRLAIFLGRLDSTGGR